MFQLLSHEVATLVWDKGHGAPPVQTILQALMDIILGQVAHPVLCRSFKESC